MQWILMLTYWIVLDLLQIGVCNINLSLNELNLEKFGKVPKNHPVDVFLIARRLNFVKADSNIPEPNGYCEINCSSKQNDAVASDNEDIQSQIDKAAGAIVNLQLTYLLRTDDIADGIISGKMGLEGGLDANDCFLIFKVAFDKSEFEIALSWAQKSLDRIKIKNMDQHIHMIGQLYEGTAACHWKLRNLEMAIDTIEKWNGNNTSNSARKKNLRESIMKEYLQRVYKKLPIFNELLASKQRNICIDHIPRNTKYRYMQLCRDDIGQLQYTNPNNTCFYKRDHPFLILGPLKVEILHLNPDVAIFRGIISEAESKWLIEKRINAMRPALVYHGNKSFPAKSRTATQSWFRKNSDYPIIRRIERLESLMANLNVPDAGEEVQIANYDVGGFYNPHMDWFADEDGKAVGRMATFLYYLTEPEAGGATVFTRLNLTVPPTKGDVLFWFNTKQNSMKGDRLTLHAGCPVLLGDKWILNHWIKHLGNQWIRPCSTNQFDFYNRLINNH